jgi:hypothetical protein
MLGDDVHFILLGIKGNISLKSSDKCVFKLPMSKKAIVGEG